MRKNYYLLIAAVLLVVFDILLYLVYSHNYEVILFKGTGYFIPLLLNVGFLMYIALRFGKWWMYILPSILAFVLGIYFVWIWKSWFGNLRRRVILKCLMLKVLLGLTKLRLFSTP